MRKIIITTIISALILAGGATLGVRHYAQALTTVGLYEADVDHDGSVSILDLSKVAHFYGQTAPLPVATPAPPTIVTNRAWGYLGPIPPVVTQLLDISNGTVVASYPGWNLPSTQSCDGLFSLMTLAGDPNTFQVVNNLTGAVLLTQSLPLFSNPIFPCPLKGAGATLNAGSPAPDRLIVRHDVPCAFYGCPSGVSGNYFLVRIYDLTNGGVLFDHGGPMEGGDNHVRWLTCSQDAVVISNSSGWLLVKLSDGSATLYAYLEPPGCVS